MSKPSPLSAAESIAYWRNYKVHGKVIEAKYIEEAKAESFKSYYCTVRLDNQSANQMATQSIACTESLFWAEDFSFENQIGFKDIKFIIWLEDRTKGLCEVSPIGKVHFPPKPKRKVHGFAVLIKKGKDLMKKGLSGGPSDLPNPYVVLHMFPDPEAITTQHTHFQPRTRDPSYSETFFFTCNANQDVYSKEIHCSVWSQEGLNEVVPPNFIGHVTIPLAPVVAKKQTNRWYSLNPLDLETELPNKASKNRKKSITEGEKRSRPREFVKNLHDKEKTVPQTQKAHHFVEKTFALQSCSLCNSTMIGTHLSCTECGIGCHQKCKDSITPTCGGLGAIRLKIEITKTLILPYENYDNVVTLLGENNYQILIYLGKVSSYREEAAKCLIKIYDEDFHSFVKSIIKQEIEQSGIYFLTTDDAKTLFRANSMASKSLDLDPTRFEKIAEKSEKSDKADRVDSKKKTAQDKEKENDPEVNAANLIKLNTIITERIFSSASKMPSALKDIFFLIQSTVMKKFPGNEIAPYTSVSGFIFLRFFAPAILGPSLFGLKVGVLDPPSSRKLLLIAKTLQNLSNLVEFGQKEPFMEPMNTFISSKIGDMKKFIDQISVQDNTPPESKDYSSEVLAREAAELHVILSQSMDKMQSVEPKCSLLAKLQEEISAIDGKLKMAEDREKLIKYDVAQDIGIDELDKDAPQGEMGKLEITDEKKIMRMLTRVDDDEDLQPLEEIAGPPIRKRGTTTRTRGISFKESPLMDPTAKKEEKKEEIKKEDTLKSNPSSGSIGGRRKSTFFGIGGGGDKGETREPGASPMLRRQSTLLQPDVDYCQCRSSDSKTERDKGKPVKEESGICPNCGKPHGKSNQFLKRMSFKVRMRSGTNLGAQPSLNICTKCNKEFSDDNAPIIIDMKAYHQGCLVCSLCKTAISESIFSLKDDIVCKGCYFIEAHLICHECTRPILKEYIIIDGKKYHASCKTCNACNKPLHGKEYAMFGNAVFCSDHKDVTCYGCQKRIEGQLVETNGRFYHPNHFICYGCGKDLNCCVFYEHNLQSYCQQCLVSFDDAAGGSQDEISSSN
ncbi:hypothetical protein HDV01_003370 [Terramyces sp. JEL0728]|nr:hypothetical protein HDV01_003370 [Terramyces sp. JEL0728]